MIYNFWTVWKMLGRPEEWTFVKDSVDHIKHKDGSHMFYDGIVLFGDYGQRIYVANLWTYNLVAAKNRSLFKKLKAQQ